MSRLSYDRCMALRELAPDIRRYPDLSVDSLAAAVRAICRLQSRGRKPGSKRKRKSSTEAVSV